MSWFAKDCEDEDELGNWLYFNKTYEMFDTNLETVDCLMTYGKPDNNYSNYIFYINFPFDIKELPWLYPQMLYSVTL